LQRNVVNKLAALNFVQILATLRRIFGPEGNEVTGGWRKLHNGSFLMAYSRAKLKSSGDKASPCFRPFWIGKLSDQ
jgi:hypothetical protein